MRELAHTLALLVDDDEQWLRTLAVGVRVATGRAPLCTTESAQALALAEAHRPGLVLLDLMMPDHDPLALIRRLRELLPSLLLLAVSGQQDPALAAAVALAGCDGYLTKPVNLPALRTSLQAAVDAKPRPARWPDTVASLTRLPSPAEAAQTVVEEALRRTRGNQRAAAQLLGISPQAVSQRCRRGHNKDRDQG